MNYNLRIILLISLFALVKPGIGQINIQGEVLRVEDLFTIPGVSITEVDNKGNRTVTDINGRFNISVKNENSIIRFDFLGFESLLAKVDTIDRNNQQYFLEESDISLINPVVLICPQPPSIEVGYYGLIKQYPFGIHSKISRWGNRGIIECNYSTLDFKDYQFYLSGGPFSLNKKVYWLPSLNPLIIIGNNNESLSANYLICLNNNLFGYLNLKYGIGARQIDNDYQSNYLLGLNVYVPFILLHQLNFEVEGIFNQDYLDYSGQIYFELFRNSYKTFSVSAGYQSLFEIKGFLLGINYKHYLIKRD